jgi:hypothetical protein
MRQAASFLAVLAFGLGNAFAQQGSSAASTGSDGDRLLHCGIRGHVPEEPGRSDQGGYGFEYQSLYGVTTDERSCTVYRLRNTPGKPPTPFRWTQGDAVVVDKGRLPRCDAETCDWLTFVKYFPGEVDAGRSELSYGLNADAYHDTAQTFVGTQGVRDDEAARAAGVRASSVGTELAGAFATADGATVALHLIVKSRFEPARDGGARLWYEIEDLAGSGALGAGAVRVEWDALDVLGVAAAWPGRPGAPPASAPGSSVDRTENGVAWAVEASAFALDESFVLRIFVRGDDEPVLVVPMPAYVPTRDPASGY